MSFKKRKPARPRRVLIFGESENDTKLVEELILALCPELIGLTRPLRKPPILIKDCDASKIPDRVEIIQKLIAAENATSEVICVFAHEDCDDFEPAHDSLAKKIEDGFSKAGHHVHAVTPAWETEAWIFLWPDAVCAYRSSWRSLESYRGKDVGRIRNAKEELTRQLRPRGRSRNVRDYRESDAPLIGAKVRELGLADKPAGRSASYDRFQQLVNECCARVDA